jgi:hypothetical protein
MEFAPEMIIRATQQQLRIGEVPTSLKPDGRGRKSHLRTWRDGWRTLRFMLLFSPAWLFMVPGVAAMVLGLALIATVAFSRVELFGHVLSTHFALLGSALSILGLQVVLLGVLAKAVFVLDGIGSNVSIERLLNDFRLEVALLLGCAAAAGGIAIDGGILINWMRSHGGALSERVTHLAIVGGTLLALGVEVVFSSFLLSILKASRTHQWV